ncbi:condensin complex subunit 1-like [Contarinia nasturtii]|uniref:condensin complex subunit 1-like n=1 Tax=Contarinia nasturtii TaxID=265458 RepID=UPI0012D42897|nr:condensin complex subunit 1-like [Contarinia nasturtii]
MNFVFEIPRNNKELLEDPNCSNYFVKQIYNVNEIQTQLRAAHNAQKRGDVFYIFDHFDTFFSVIENADQLQIQNLIRAVDILYNTMERLGQWLNDYFKLPASSQESSDEQKDYLNLTKMVMYLLVSTLKVTDKCQKDQTTPPKSTGRKKKKNLDESQPYFITYEKKRYEVLIQICNIMQMPIEKLWNMLIVEENFVNLVCDLAYRSLVHPSIKEKRVNDAVFQILGIAIKQYRHGMAFPVQIVEILEREELAVMPIAHGVSYLNDTFGITSVLANLLTEIIERVNVNPASQVTSKHLSLFIAEIGAISTQLSLQCLDMAPDLLNLESYSVRNSLFAIMNDIIVNHLSGEDLNNDQKTLREECLEDLWNHMNDTSSYVRSKVIHIWNDLKNQNAVPLEWILRVVTRAIERLEDKTATVRKNAITLLKSFLESNPFASTLQLEVIEQKLQKEVKEMNELQEKFRNQHRIAKDLVTDYDERCAPELEPILTSILSDDEQTKSLTINDTLDETNSEQRIEIIRKYLRNGHFDDVAAYIIKLDASAGNYEKWKSLQTNEKVLYFNALLKSYLFDDYESELDKQATIVGFLQDALQFSQAIAGAVPKLEEMLMSTTSSDTLEAIEFFKTGYLFDIKGTETGMKLMLRLLYLINTGQEKDEKSEAVMRAYHQILFGTDATDRMHHVKVVDNLCKFLECISIDEYTAFELMIKKWCATEDINVNTINVLFERFTLKLPETSANAARCCMELLILVSNAKPAVSHNNMKLIMDIINSHRILHDPRIFSGCLQLLMNSIQPEKVQKSSDYYKRIDNVELNNAIVGSFTKFFFYPKLPDFESIASQTINFLYKMCTSPDVLCQDIIHGLCTKLMEISEKRHERNMETDDSGYGSPLLVQMYIPKYLLPRIIFIFGYVATKELVYLNDDVTINVKYREKLSSQSQGANRSGCSEGTPNRRYGSVDSRSTSPVDGNDSAYGIGATAEDNLGELINNICDSELIGSVDGLLYHFVPILNEILSHPAKYTDEYVQRAALLTFLRFMACSSTYCADKIAFLMNILRKTKTVSMKCNIIIGLADLTGRFANTVEPWIPNFFVMLFEEDDSVRLTTLKMLSHVILQAIIRVTGQISEMAVCIIDTNFEIQNTAKEFFRQLVNSKELEYYKVMPDIISRLSTNETPTPEDKFRIIMRYLFGLVHKDRPTEILTDKLCCRFRNTNTERQWRDIAFCLSLLNPSEKTMKKLIEHLPGYKDKLQVDDIYDCFRTIITNANKHFIKPGLKEATKEFDAKLQKCLEAGQNNISINVSTIDTEDVPTTIKPKRNSQKTTRNSKKRERARIVSSDEDDDDFEENIPPLRPRRAPKRK